MTVTVSTIADFVQLSRREREISDQRRELHHAIDKGEPTEWMLKRERDISAERRELHRRIDAIRAELWPSPPAAPTPPPRRPWFR
jgi:anti-sigma-K factor RsiG